MEKFYPTKAGIEYAALTAQGKIIEFTKGKFGDGVRSTENITELTDLIHPLGELPISKKSVKNSTIITTTQFSNRVGGSILPTFYLMEIGLFAKVVNADGTDDDEHPETLIGYAFDGHGDKIIGTSLSEFIINIPLTVADVNNVTVDIDSLVYPTLKQFEDENTVAKYTIPAPAQTYLQFIVPSNIESTRKYYPTNEELIADIAAAYKDVIKQFYDAGCRNLQLDDCSWGSVIGENANADVFGLSADEFKKQLLTVNNLALEGKADDMVITSHICRGNYHSTFFSSGGYAPVADYVFALENVDALFLEYDDERSGDFAPLAKVSSDKQVVLGLITTKSPKLESKEAVIARINEAAKYIPIERLCLSPQCGFASCEIGNKLTEDEQWAKLKLVKEIAEEVWK